MKISQMTTDKAADVLVRIADPVANIVDDDKISDILKEISDSKNVPYIKLFASMLPKIVSLALENHRNDLYEIVGALSGKSVSDVKKQNVLETIKVIRESVDSDLIDFFGSFGGQDRTAEIE